MTDDDLWALVDKWQDTARERVDGNPSFLSKDPRIAHAQALNEAAEDLGDLLLDWPGSLRSADGGNSIEGEDRDGERNEPASYSGESADD